MPTLFENINRKVDPFVLGKNAVLLMLKYYIDQFFSIDLSIHEYDELLKINVAKNRLN